MKLVSPLVNRRNSAVPATLFIPAWSLMLTQSPAYFRGGDTVGNEKEGA
jgi:hypothetical protein